MSNYAIHVSGVSPATTKEHLHDFFTFCGKIKEIDFKGTEGPSTVYFDKPSAVHTALMLNGGTLDGAHLTVSSDEVHPEEDHEAPHADGVPFTQSDKPRAGIAAEYLAKGYTLSDQILQRAIEMDNQKGISKRFLSYFSSLDSTVGNKAIGPDQTVTGKLQEHYNTASGKARELDEQKGFSKTLLDYYSKALATPTGQKVRAFYTTTSKQVLDIHEEARRIADAHKANAASSAPPVPPTGDAKSAEVQPSGPPTIAAPTTI